MCIRDRLYTYDPSGFGIELHFPLGVCVMPLFWLLVACVCVALVRACVTYGVCIFVLVVFAAAATERAAWVLSGR